MQPNTKTPVANDASKGLVTSRDPSTLGPGELTEAVSCEYRVGSPHLYKLPGRELIDTVGAVPAPVLAITKLQYDGEDDIFVVDTGGVIHEGEELDSLSPVVTGLSTTSIPQYTGFKNAWIRCNGVDANYIRESGAVPNGTTGNWRPTGMDTALAPSLNVINHYSGGGQTLRPTTFTNTAGPIYAPSSLGGGLTQVTSGYHDPVKAIDGPGTGTGTVSGTVGLQILSGSGTSFTTQLSIGALMIFSTGEQVEVQSIASDTELTITTPLRLPLAAGTYSFINATTAPDPLETRAWSFSGDNPHILPGTSTTPLAPRINQCVWKFTTDISGVNRVLSVNHNGSISPRDQGPNFGAEGATWLVEYSLNGGSTWNTLGFPRHTIFENPVTDTVAIPDNLVLTNNLWIRATSSSAVFTRISGQWLDVYHAVYDIKVSTGASGAYSAANPIYYGISEVYVDSDGVEHQGNMGVVIDQGTVSGGLYIPASDFQNVTSVVLNLPQPINPRTVNFIVWRSVDTPGGGYPVMYAVGHPLATDSTWTDLLTIRPDDTAALALQEQYKILKILYPTGDSTLTSFYSKPPVSKMTLTFQGCVVYFPADPTLARRTYYSLPATVSVNALEQVPEQYYLDYQTPKNDEVQSGAVTNGGRSMVVFFENYTMLVNYLPQGADPGGFNNTVKEYVSNVRGCAGRFACVEFTQPAGETLVAAVDGLGLWVTNGVNMVDEWSLDLNWDVAMSGVDLSAIELYDKPHKRRLEMLYVDADGNQREYHFFYGVMKQGPNGKAVPLITGPHPSNARCRYYGIVDGVWAGLSGGNANEPGTIYNEDSGSADESHGYDDTGIVPQQFTMGDVYTGGIQTAHIVETANVKFGPTPSKDINMHITLTRDAGATEVLHKTIAGDGTAFPRLIYIHGYCDRHRIGFSDLTNTAAAPFINYVAKTRSAGSARDK